MQKLIKFNNYLKTRPRRVNMGEASETGSNNAVNKSSGSGSGSSVLSFVLGRSDNEEKTIVFKIENFSEFLDLSNAELKENGVVFEAGTCLLQDGTKIAATWKYYCQHAKKNEEDWVGAFLNLFLDLKGPKSKLKSAKGLYSVSLSSGDNDNIISSFKSAARREFASTNGWGWENMMTKSEFLEKTKATDTLDVSLQLKVFSNQGFAPILQAVSPSPLAAEMKGEASSDFLKMLESGDGSDVEIRVPKEAGGDVDDDSNTKRVHKGVLMSRSTVFSKMFAEGGEMVEAKEGKVVISDLSPKGLEVFLHFLYSGEVLDEWVKVPEEILNCADKYDLGKLKLFCAQNIMAVVSTRNALEMYQFAKLHNLPEALTALEEFIDRNTKAVLTEGTWGQGQRQME